MKSFKDFLHESDDANMTERDAHGLLKSRGWSIKRQGSDHTLFNHPESDITIAVPRHRGNLSPGVARKISKQSKVSKDGQEDI